MTSIKKNRHCEKRIKWSNANTEKLLSYLEANTPFEKPNAHIYYEHLETQMHLGIPWTSYKLKVHNLRQCMQKTEEWLSTTGTGCDKNGATAITVSDKVRKMCPYYERLFQYFKGNKSKALSEVKVEPDIDIDIDDNVTIDFMDTFSEGCNTETSNTTMTTIETSGCPTINAENCSEKLTDLEKKRTKLQVEESQVQKMTDKFSKRESKQKLIIKKKKLTIDKKKLEIYKCFEESKLINEQKKLDLEREKLLLAKQRSERNFEIQKMKMDLKKMELESRERMFKYEVDKKYEK